MAYRSPEFSHAHEFLCFILSNLDQTLALWLRIVSGGGHNKSLEVRRCKRRRERGACLRYGTSHTCLQGNQTARQPAQVVCMLRRRRRPMCVFYCGGDAVDFYYNITAILLLGPAPNTHHKKQMADNFISAA
jgi:hypothetical protein